MAGRPPKVDHVKNEFLREVVAAENLVVTVMALPRRTNQYVANGIHPKNIRQIVELAFMGIVAAWEDFLERSLVRYVAGARTDSGYSPTKKYGNANTIIHAYELLSQDANYDPQKHYLKVNDPRWVWRTADFFFRTHTYVDLSNYLELLRHANHIRNRVAHGSEKCKADFKTTAIWFLHPNNNQLTQGYGPGELLLSTAQRHFPQQSIQNGHNHFKSYIEIYKFLSAKIVP